MVVAGLDVFFTNLISQIPNNLTPPYLKGPIPPVRTHLFGRRSVNVINEIRCKTNNYRNNFYPDSIRSWDRIGPELRNSPNLKSFKESIISLVTPPTKSIFDIHDPLAIKWFYQLRVGSKPLHDHKLKHTFSDIRSDKCDVCNTTENHFVLHCTRFTEAIHPLSNAVLSLNDVKFVLSLNDVKFVLSLNDDKFALSLNDVKFVLSLNDVKFVLSLNDVKFVLSLNDVKFVLSLNDVKFVLSLNDVKFVLSLIV